MTIHTVGDSHSENGWDHSIVKHHLGPILCYSFGREKMARCNISNFNNLKENDSIIFCFGEIDCRCHIYKHVSDTKSYQSIIENIVDNYVDAIQTNIDQCKVSLKHVCIYNVVPPTQKHNTIEDPHYPYCGSDEERKSYILYFNQCLQQKCVEKKWVFFDIYHFYTDSNGFLLKNMSDTKVHIGDGRYLKEFIDTHLL